MQPTRLIMTTLAITVAAVAANSAVQAREPGVPRSERTFERLDKDNNGALDKTELATGSERRFMRLDADKDGKVTRAEVEGWLNRLTRRRVERIMSRMDANKDDAVSLAELQDHISSLFLAADADRSDGVTLQEAQAYHAARSKARAVARKAASAVQQ